MRQAHMCSVAKRDIKRFHFDFTGIFTLSKSYTNILPVALFYTL